MRTYLVAFFLAAIVAVLVTPIARKVAPKFGAVDLPSGRRVNKKIIPRMGGVAILAGFLAPLAGLAVYSNAISEIFLRDIHRAYGLILGAIAIAALGAVDDVKGVRATTKLAVQVVIAIGAYAGGFRIATVTLPFLGHLDMGVFGAPITVLWIVGIVNAVNLLDGLDGLAAGVSFFVCVVSFVTGMISNNVLVCMLAVSLGGALVGFLFFNFNPATIFMGDTGSMTIGYVLATTSLLGTKGGTAVALLVPVLAMGVPILDTLLAIVRRMLERRPIFSPDKGHLHHRLLDMGLTHRRAVLAIYAMSLLFTGAAIVVYMGRTWQIGMALALATALAFGMMRILGIIQSAKSAANRRIQRYDLQTDKLRRTVPEWIRRTTTLNTAAEVTAALVAFAEQSNLRYVGCDNATIPVLGGWHWESPRTHDGAESNYLSATYALRGDGAAKGELKFGWNTDTTAVAAETAILLQLAVDALRAALDRLQADADPATEPTAPRVGGVTAHGPVGT